jgi:hypothetical protein
VEQTLAWPSLNLYAFEYLSSAYPQSSQPAAPAPQIYNPSSMMTPGKNLNYNALHYASVLPHGLHDVHVGFYDNDDEDDDSSPNDALATSTSSLEKFRSLWNKPDVSTATGSPSPFLPGPLNCTLLQIYSGTSLAPLGAPRRAMMRKFQVSFSRYDCS